MVIGWIIAILGVWVGLTPFFGAATGFYAWSHWIVGAIAAIVGFSMVGRRAGEGWASALLGVWLFVAGFIGSLLMGAGLWWDNILVGLALLLLGIAAARSIPRARTATPSTA